MWHCLKLSWQVLTRWRLLLSVWACGAQATTLFKYDGSSAEGELSFSAGETINIMSGFDDEALDGWWRGQLVDGTVGVFPSNHVVMQF